MNVAQSFRSLSRFEWLLWLGSLGVLVGGFLLGGNTGMSTLVASLVGATALIFVSKGDVLGQVLTVVFSLLYAVISFEQHYYGEMITYLGMTSPIAVLSVIAWLRHPYEVGKAQVAVAKLSPSKLVWMLVLTALVTGGFYFVLKAFETTNLLVSTVSIATSFCASYLMLFRSPAYALAYAANDIVLIVLWVLACLRDLQYLPMVLCFVIFFINDTYGFFNWRKMMHRQTPSRAVNEHSDV